MRRIGNRIGVGAGFGLVGVSGLSALLAGCSAGSGAAGGRAAAAADASGGIAPSWSNPAEAQNASPANGFVDPVAEMQRQMAGVAAAANARPVIVPEVDWGVPAGAEEIAQAALRRDVFEVSVERTDERIDATSARSAPEEETAADATTQSDAEPEPLYADVETLTQDELLEELHRRVQAMEAPPMRRALAASGLSLIRPGLGADPTLRARLEPTQAQLLERFETLMAELARRIESGDLSELDAAGVAEAVSALQGPRPLSLRNTSLCRRVSGFGVYEPFTSYDFIAGREHRAIVYAEVEHFETVPVAKAEGAFEVKLRQEVTLFNEADGLAVWQQPAQPVDDVSRRVRRDFWVVQMITLPANLGVGKYRLKVRVTDVHGGTVDEATLPIRLIADHSALDANPAADALNGDEPTLTETQRELLRTLAPGLFTDDPRELPVTPNP